MLKKGIMITQNQVKNNAILKLKELNFEIYNNDLAKDKGINILARKVNKKLFLKTIGGTSSREDSNRAGQPFNRGQAREHISAGIFKLLQLREYNRESLLGIALPYEEDHYEFIQSIMSSLAELRITMFWCDGKDVKIENNNLD